MQFPIFETNKPVIYDAFLHKTDAMSGHKNKLWLVYSMLRIYQQTCLYHIIS